MSEMLKRVAAFGGENSACGTADPKDAPAFQSWSKSDFL